MLTLTREQQERLRHLSDDKLYHDAKEFIDKNGTIKHNQIAGLENIADNASGFSAIVNFTRHQAGKEHSNASAFYGALTKYWQEFLKELKTNRAFLPENLSKRQLREHTEFYGLLAAREFIRHLEAEHRYQAKER